MPDWKHLVRERLAPLGMTAGAESDLVEEVAQHLEDHFTELRSAGSDTVTAYRQTMAELGDLYPIRANLSAGQRLPKHDVLGGSEQPAGSFAEGIGKDLRYALRGMRKNPIFVLAVVLTLAVGLGANTTVFTLINTLILNPLPVPHAGELAAVAGLDAQTASKSGSLFPISYPDLKDYESGNQVFASLAGYTSVRPMTLQEHGASEGVFGEFVTGNYFSTLSLTPARGRFFADGEDSVAGAHPVAVMNYATWQQRFGGAENIVGRDVRVNNTVITVIGVAPRHFIGVNAIFGPDLWLPVPMAERLFPNAMPNLLNDRTQAVFTGVGRLRPHSTMAGAQANLQTLAAGLARAYPATNEGHTATVRPLRDVLLAVNGGSASGMLFAGVALSIVVGLVLLIACSNVANLLLARSAARQQEMAIRLAMGASRYRLIRQLLTESVLLGLMSGVVGLLLAWQGIDFLFGRLPGSANFPVPKLDTLVFAFALLASLATGFLFGAIPAWKASRASIAGTLKESGRTAGRSRRRITVANGLLVGQVAFSFLLLVTAALFLRSIGRAYAMDPGFQTAHLAVFPASPGQAGYGKGQAAAYYREVRDRVGAIPGVASVSWASNMPLWARSVNGLQVEGREARSRTDQIRTVINTVDRDYFETAGVAIENGRSFTNVDRQGSLPVAIVNERLAHDYWPAGALGKRIQLPGEKVMRQIVGVARVANYSSWGEPPQSCVYVPLAQTDAESMVLYVRSQGDPRELMAPVEREMRSIAPQILLFGIRTGREVIDGGLFQARMGVGLLTTFGLLALGLASIGLYGVMAYAVNLRKRELGLRMALGATRGSVLRLVLGEGMSLVLAGLTAGLTAAWFVGRLLSRMLFGLGGTDPASITGAALTLCAVALIACYLPARRATRVDPLEALREG